VIQEAFSALLPGFLSRWREGCVENLRNVLPLGSIFLCETVSKNPQSDIRADVIPRAFLDPVRRRQSLQPGIFDTKPVESLTISAARLPRE
jgi:hypothetical protein